MAQDDTLLKTQQLTKHIIDPVERERKQKNLLRALRLCDTGVPQAPIKR